MSERYKTIILLLLVFSWSPQAGFGKSQRAVVWKEFIAFEGQLVQEMDEEPRKKFYKLTNDLLPPITSNDAKYDVSPVVFCKYLSEEKTSYVLFLARGLLSIPGDSRGQAYVFDESGNILWTNNFSLGRRDDFISANVIRDQEIGQPVIQITTHHSKQIYMLVKNEVVLVRLDGYQGITPNQFTSTNQIVGPPIPNLSPVEWERKLASESPAEVLQVLAWLSGEHLDLKEPQERYDDSFIPPNELIENSITVTQALDRPEVQAQLKRLKTSPIKWVREAAVLAQAHDYRNQYFRDWR